MSGGAGLLAAALMTALVSGCSRPATDAAGSSVARALYGSNLRGEPLQLKGDTVAVENQSGRDWMSVEIWLNTYYRATTPFIPAGGRAQAPLTTFYDGYGRPFSLERARPRSLRLTARLPDGQTLELRKPLR